MKKALVALAFLALTLVSALLWRRINPPPPQPPYVETRWLMGTQAAITISGLPEEKAKTAAQAAFAHMERIDARMARRPGTPLNELNTKGEGTVSKELLEVLTSGLSWAEKSGGAFDPTVGALVDLWAVESGPHPPPPQMAVDAAKARVGWRKAAVDAATMRVDTGGTILELGGIAKGYAIDLAASELAGSGAVGFIVDVGGDLALAGARNSMAWRVGLQNPREPASLFRVLTPKAGAIVTSGDYERYFEWEDERYSHIIDPFTGVPAKKVRSATVWAEKAMDADALATAICVMGAEEGLKLVAANPPAQALVIDSEGKVWESPGFSQVAPTAGASK